MTKKRLFFIIIMAIAILMVPGAFVSAATVTTPEGIVFDTSAGTVTGYIGSASTLIIPSMINGISVNNIGPGAFYHCSTLSSITVQEGITNIGVQAFEQCAINSINLPGSIKTISFHAFDGWHKFGKHQFRARIREHR